MESSKTKVLVFGAGPVGLTVACVMAKHHKVYVYECQEDKRASLKLGKPHFFEPGLQKLLQSGLNSKNLEFIDQVGEAVLKNVKMAFICVGTPTNEETGFADTDAVEKCLATIYSTALFNGVVVIKSTITVGYTEMLSQKYGRQIVFCPEFLRQGTAISDFENPDRVVFGLSNNCDEMVLGELQDFYKTFVGHTKIICTNSESAELAKYGSNLFLALKVSFANEVAALGNVLGADVNSTLSIIGADHRIGEHFLRPGLGFGGSCLPKDTRAWIAMANQSGVSCRLASATQETNKNLIELAVKEVEVTFGQDLKEKNVGILGLAFKPGIDDMRESPGLALAKELAKKTKSCLAYDPLVTNNLDYAEIEIVSMEILLKKADFLVITTADLVWAESNLSCFSGPIFNFARTKIGDTIKLLPAFRGTIDNEILEGLTEK